MAYSVKMISTFRGNAGASGKPALMIIIGKKRRFYCSVQVAKILESFDERSLGAGVENFRLAM